MYKYHFKNFLKIILIKKIYKDIININQDYLLLNQKQHFLKDLWFIGKNYNWDIL